jgi:hypothetical protein
VAEVEHPKLAEIPDAFGDLGQVVLGQDECLQVGPEPYLIRHDAEPLPSEGKMWCQLIHSPWPDSRLFIMAVACANHKVGEDRCASIQPYAMM